MPIITSYNPLGEGLDAAASAIQGGNDARDKALALARAREQTLYDRGEDQKRDQATADDFTERKSEFGSTHALDVQRTEADISHTQHQDKISDAVEATRAKMAPLLEQAQALQLKVTAGQITQDQARTQGLIIANNTAKAQAALEAQFGKPMAQMALAQAEANYSSTQAGTASTNASTARTNALLPYDTAQASLNLTGTGLENTGRALTNRATFDSLQSTTNTPLQKQLAADYKGALTSFTSRSNTYDRLASAGRTPKGADGKPLPPPAEPTSPTDLEALISDAVDAVKSGKDTVAAQRAGIEKKLASGAFTPYQARYAEAQLLRQTQGALRNQALRNTNVSGLMGGPSTPGSSIGGQAFGGPGAGNSPFSSVVAQFGNVEKQYGLPAGILRAVGMQESGLGTSPNFNPRTGTDRDANKGHGLFQLDPASGYPQSMLNRAAQDPHYATQVAAQMLAGFLKQAGGNIRLALAMYNDGTRPGQKGFAYADQVLGRA